MFQPWVKFCINHNLRYMVYFVWMLVLPFFLFSYVGQAAEDALNDLKVIKNLEKE